MRELGVFGRARIDAQSVDIGLHQGAQSIVDQAVSFDRALASERARDNCHIEMTASVARTRVPHMKMTLIFDQHVRWGKGLSKDRLNFSRAIFGHGNTRLNGFTVTLA